MDPLTKYALSFWAKYIKNHWISYTIGLLSVFFTNVFQVIVARDLGWILDFFRYQKVPFFFQGLEHDDVFFGLFLLLLLPAFGLFLARVGWRRTLTRESHLSAAVLKKNIWRSARFFKKEDLGHTYTKGVLMNAVTSDANTAKFAFGFTMVATFDAVFLGLLTLGTMFSINTPLSLGVMFFFIILPVILKKLFDLEGRAHEKAQHHLGLFNDLVVQGVSTIRMQRLAQTGAFWTKRLLESADRYRLKRLKAVHISFLYTPLMGISNIGSYLVLFTFGIFLVFEEKLSLGDFVAMQGLLFLLEGPLLELGFITSEWRKGITCLKRLCKISTADREVSLTQEGETVHSQSLVFRAVNLTLQHKGTAKALFRDLNFTVERGEWLGVIGPVGVGKTTLLNTLAGFERGIEGELFFYGHPFSYYSHRALRREIGFVAQKPFVFAETLSNNLLLDGTFSREALWEALAGASFDREVEAFPKGLETPLGEWGINLSGGQKQRLGLARVLLRRPDILFLDDCLSAVDTVTEERILSYLSQEFKGHTLVWAAHRKSTLKYCHRLLELP